MGNNLKGKECGKGIYQRKDGLYSAKYYDKQGRRKEKYFETLPEADIKYLTMDEQEQFLEAAKCSHNYRQYDLLLETGLRTAELIGLTWASIDWKMLNAVRQFETATPIGYEKRA